MNLLPKILPRNDGAEQQAERERTLIRQEAALGGQMFGPVPNGHQRQFFCLDEHTWVWHEEWTDQSGQKQVVTTRYEVWPNGVLKSQNGQPYKRLTAAEARHLYQAAGLYRQRVGAFYRQTLHTA
ncbi:MAG TPA: hypothetical protein VG992_03950 [Candidatus Saccharimonadales bacterium]|nr:hypothetical protein [Candidatus Saccharimonadales bacterium]